MLYGGEGGVGGGIKGSQSSCPSGEMVSHISVTCDVFFFFSFFELFYLLWMSRLGYFFFFKVV